MSDICCLRIFFCCDLVWPNLTNVEKSKLWLERQTSLEIRVLGCDRRPCYFFEQASSYYFCGETAWFKDWGLVANAKSRLCSNAQPIMWYREISVFKPWFLFLLCVIQLLEMFLVWLWEPLDAIPKPARPRLQHPEFGLQIWLGEGIWSCWRGFLYLCLAHILHGLSDGLHWIWSCFLFPYYVWAPPLS